nr:hypothetical protein [bacterium]
MATLEHATMAENCGLQTAVIILVVHIAPGPIQTFTQLAHASNKAFVPSSVQTLPAIIVSSFQNDNHLTFLIA